MGIIDFHIVDDNVYSDTARALVMAYHSQDSRLLGDVMNNIVSPLLSEENGIQKMLLACVRGYHSMAFAMSSLTEMSFADII